MSGVTSATMTTRPAPPDSSPPTPWTVRLFSLCFCCRLGLDSECCRAELLTNVCLYWFSGCITSSTRLYYETLGPLATGEGRSLFVRKAEVPCGALHTFVCAR